METDRSNICGCKGIRTCLKCERLFGIEKQHFETNKENFAYVFCPYCRKCWPGWEADSYKSHPAHEGEPFALNGISLILDFISEDEEKELIQEIDLLQWDPSQSGRRKQNFGPKCNFKKRRLRLGDFDGFPKSTHFIQERFSTVDLLKDYITIEQCSLEYDPKRGASIDPHIDDCWIWGERIVTMNLLADTVLTLKPYRGDNSKYNLSMAPEKYQTNNYQNADIKVRIPLPRRSLIIMFGEARYMWEHLIYREDIYERRVCLAYREFTEPYLTGGEHAIEAEDIIKKAHNYWT